MLQTLAPGKEVVPRAQGMGAEIPEVQKKSCGHWMQDTDAWGAYVPAEHNFDPLDVGHALPDAHLTQAVID
jgi:hypothetical protein